MGLETTLHLRRKSSESTFFRFLSKRLRIDSTDAQDRLRAKHRGMRSKHHPSQPLLHCNNQFIQGQYTLYRLGPYHLKITTFYYCRLHLQSGFSSKNYYIYKVATTWFWAGNKNRMTPTAPSSSALAKSVGSVGFGH